MVPLSMSAEREQRVAKRYPVNSLYSITTSGKLPSMWLFSFVYVRHIYFASNLTILLLPREEARVRKEALSFLFSLLSPVPRPRLWWNETGLKNTRDPDEVLILLHSVQI
jgi:hypothetical protein